MNDIAIFEEKIKAIVIYKFMYEFDKFEKIVKKYFDNKLDELDINDSNRLYFYCGGLVNKNLYIDFSNEMLCLNNYRFKPNNFDGLTINQIIKVASSNGLGQMFDIEIDSIQKHLKHDMRSSIMKLIKMRNKLAHDLAFLDLKDSDCIELLSNDKLNELGGDIIYGLELKEEYEQVKLIFSNIIYMRKICSELCNSWNL